MNILLIKKHIEKHPNFKKLVHFLMMNSQGACPRIWVKLLLNPILLHYGKESVIRRSAIMNVSPINTFYLGEKSIVEYYSIIDNGVGVVHIGDNSRVGLRNTIIGPVHIGNNVILAQNIVLSGLNHNYKDISMPIRKQGVSVSPIIIEDECWIGANCTITAGVRIGKHSVVAGGSVVTKDIPDYCIAAGNPACVIKQYDFNKKEWIKVQKS